MSKHPQKGAKKAMQRNAYHLVWKLFALALTLSSFVVVGCHSCGCGR